jgi:sec-independent protein translocase protein TatC
VFGVAFQLPLVQLALVRVGLVEIEFFKKQRKIVYFVMTIVAAVTAPGDVVTSMVALLVPMIVLYEFGIWLAQWGEKQRKLAEEKESSQ